MTGSIRCPRCSAELHVAHGGDAHLVCACLSCGGVWLDAKTANDVKSAFGEWAVRVANHAASTAQIAPDTQSSRSLACPTCQKQMRKARVPGAGFEIDLCDPHGTFYDRGELSAALQAVQATKKPSAKRLYVPAAVGLGAVAVGGAAAMGVAAIAHDPHAQLHAQSMTSSVVDVAGDVAEIAIDVVDVAEIGGSLFGFLFEALGSIDF